MTTRDQQRIDVLARWREGALTVSEAAALLGSSERTAWRLLGRFRAAGVDGIVHGNRGRASPRRLAAATRERTAELARTRYRGVNDSHLTELLAEDEGIVIGRSSLQRLLRGSGLGTARRRRSPKYRSRRERMPQAGLLVQIDGSPHDWLEGRGPRLTLVGAIDDATGAIVAAVFAPTEDGRAYLAILARMCRDHGVPAAVYRDRSGIFAPLRPGGPLGDAGTQVGRAFAELGINSIPAASPQAKGRIERLWGTCQDRLVSELRLAEVTDLAGATVVLERFVGRFNAAFSVPPAIATPAWRAAPAARELDRICAFRWSGSWATTTRFASRVPCSSCRRRSAGGASPVDGSRSNSGSTAACWWSITGGSSWSRPCRPTGRNCAASDSWRHLGPPRQWAVPSDPAIDPDQIIRGTVRDPRLRAAEE